MPNDDVAERLAEMAGFDKGYVVVLMHAHRAGAERAALWSSILGRLSSNGTGLAVAAGALFVAAADHGGLCLMSTARRRLRLAVDAMSPQWWIPGFEPLQARPELADMVSPC